MSPSSSSVAASLVLVTSTPRTVRQPRTESNHIPGLALCYLTFPLKTVPASVSSDHSRQSSELDLQTRAVEENRKHSAVQSPEQETVIINEIVEFINTKYQSQSHNRQQVGAESVFYCSEGCFVFDKNTCYHKHLST